MRSLHTIRSGELDRYLVLSFISETRLLNVAGGDDGDEFEEVRYALVR